jgi:hypothetical protein
MSGASSRSDTIWPRMKSGGAPSTMLVEPEAPVDILRREAADVRFRSGWNAPAFRSAAPKPCVPLLRRRGARRLGALFYFSTHRGCGTSRRSRLPRSTSAGGARGFFLSTARPTIGRSLFLAHYRPTDRAPKGWFLICGGLTASPRSRLHPRGWANPYIMSLILLRHRRTDAIRCAYLLGRNLDE